MKYILYCRKSTEAEDRQVLSIDSQENELRRLAEKEGININKVFKESMTAKQPGRIVFDEMMNYIEQTGECILLAWKLDRLARNALDGGRLSWFMDRGLIKEIKTFERVFRNTGDDKFMMSLDFGMAKKYVDDLSVNVKRGHRAKLEKGGWTGRAPLGYFNDKGEKTIVVDPIRAPYIKRIFELYASGTKSLKDVANIIYNEGFRGLSGQKVRRGLLHRMLSNNFYCGLMSKNGKTYQGNHEALVSITLFEQAKEVLTGKHHSCKQKHFFPYRGFMYCHECGCALTATKKKGHDYYYCTNGRGNCEQHKKYLRENHLEQEIAKVFDKLNFDEEFIDLAYEASKEKMMNNQAYHEKAKENLLKQLDLVKIKRNKLLDSYLSELIDKEAYEAKIGLLNDETAHVNAQLKQLEKESQNDFSTLEQTKKVFLRAKNAKKDFLCSSDVNKCNILEILLWNLAIANGEVAKFSFKQPYQMMADEPKKHEFSFYLGVRSTLGTL